MNKILTSLKCLIVILFIGMFITLGYYQIHLIKINNELDKIEQQVYDIQKEYEQIYNEIESEL